VPEVIHHVPEVTDHVHDPIHVVDGLIKVVPALINLVPDHKEIADEAKSFIKQVEMEFLVGFSRKTGSAVLVFMVKSRASHS
jgi:hypothetical protein